MRCHISHHEGRVKTRSGDVKKLRVSITSLYEGEHVTHVAGLRLRRI